MLLQVLRRVHSLQETILLPKSGIISVPASDALIFLDFAAIDSAKGWTTDSPLHHFLSGSLHNRDEWQCTDFEVVQNVCKYEAGLFVCVLHVGIDGTLRSDKSLQHHDHPGHNFNSKFLHILLHQFKSSCHKRLLGNPGSEQIQDDPDHDLRLVPGFCNFWTQQLYRFLLQSGIVCKYFYRNALW
ncbi:uncharacterized protein LOC113387616 [Ctenocephalides felis]|uniref:uncharacterized protein LOC113387616 n=1 Tax=Ctenocephalides felis TaxID=7515 RepID=UPI000E6E4AD2|nr:uncharacterized protein LOC113387616 [Ctenocephalides felis]